MAQHDPYARVDSLMRLYNWKIKDVNEIYRLTHYIRTNFDADSLRVRACFIWITHNIAYDVRAYNGSDLMAGSVDYALKKRKAVCSGYASLFKLLCDALDIECEIVTGYARGVGNSLVIHDKNIPSNHAWNAVKVNGTWRLLDATWAAGFVTEKNGILKKFFRNFNETYFFTPPHKLVLNHFPNKHKFQFLPTPIKEKDFKSVPRFEHDYLNDSIVEVFPQGIPLKAKKGDTLTFRFRSIAVVQRSFLFALSPDKEKTLYRGWAELKPDGWYEFKYPVSVTGTYPLYIGYEGNITRDYLWAYRLIVN
jgi:hypothetical protein